MIATTTSVPRSAPAVPGAGPAGLPACPGSARLRAPEAFTAPYEGTGLPTGVLAAVAAHVDVPVAGAFRAVQRTGHDNYTRTTLGNHVPGRPGS